MDRRTFIQVAGSAVLVCPLSSFEQQTPSVPLIGFLCLASPTQWTRLVAAFRQGLGEAGLVEGKNIAIEFRWANDHLDRLPALAAELVRRDVSVLVATGGPQAALAAKTATSKIPIVFTLGYDPVALGVVDNLARPGGNVTGITFIAAQLNEKRVELLAELVPNADSIALLLNPDNPGATRMAVQVTQAARFKGTTVHALQARNPQEIDDAFTALERLRARALFVASDGLFYDRREQLVALTARYAVPATFELREFVTAGGLMSYGASLPEVYRQAGLYAAKILSGAKPADLPILQPTKVELVINLRTATALGLTIPQSLLLRADEVIQ